MKRERGGEGHVGRWGGGGRREKVGDGEMIRRKERWVNKKKERMIRQQSQRRSDNGREEEVKRIMGGERRRRRNRNRRTERRRRQGGRSERVCQCSTSIFLIRGSWNTILIQDTRGSMKLWRAAIDAFHVERGVCSGCRMARKRSINHSGWEEKKSQRGKLCRDFTGNST